MAISDVLRVFRDLKREGVVRDYVVFGSVAAMVLRRPFFTRDIDIGLAVQSDEEFQEVFRWVSDFGHVESRSVVIEGTPVEMFPVNISPVIEDALAQADRKRVGGVLVKVAPVEHLLVEALRVNRASDKGRVFMLDEVVNGADCVAN